MVTVDGNWVMEGLSRDDPRCIKSCRELTDFINEVGFLPFFKSKIEGFSVEELTASSSWWCGDPSEDPWEWRELIASEGKIAYGKFFSGKAGFISKEWFPVFAAYRRDGYDFDSRYEDGLAGRKHKKIIDVLEKYDSLPSNELKSLAGFNKGGEKGFDGAVNTLQMQTYLLVSGFFRKRNKKNEEYGWPVANYMISEKLFGDEYVKSAYSMGADGAKEMLIRHLKERFPNITTNDAEKLFK